jgi:hypothetical protein
MPGTGFPRADAENDFLPARRHHVRATLARHLRHQPTDRPATFRRPRPHLRPHPPRTTCDHDQPGRDRNPLGLAAQSAPGKLTGPARRAASNTRTGTAAAPRRGAAADGCHQPGRNGRQPGRITHRLGIHRVLEVTGLAATTGFLILTQLPAGGGYNPLLAAVVLIGFGTAGTAFATMVIASAGITDTDQGLVGGVINTSRQLGAAIGAALLPAVAGAVNHTGNGMATGDRAAMLTGATAAGLATLVAVTARRKPTTHKAHT